MIIPATGWLLVDGGFVSTPPRSVKRPLEFFFTTNRKRTATDCLVVSRAVAGAVRLDSGGFSAAIRTVRFDGALPLRGLAAPESSGWPAFCGLLCRRPSFGG